GSNAALHPLNMPHGPRFSHRECRVAPCPLLVRVELRAVCDERVRSQPPTSSLDRDIMVAIYVASPHIWPPCSSPSSRKDRPSSSCSPCSRTSSVTGTTLRG